MGMCKLNSFRAWLGVANTYWIDVISYFVVIASLLLMVIPRVPVEKRAQAGVGALVDGMRFLAVSGAADMVRMILRGVVIQLTTPDEFRGRISAVNAMFVIGGPMLGQFESGVVAGVVSPQFSVVSGGVACILATVAIAAC